MSDPYRYHQTYQRGGSHGSYSHPQSVPPGHYGHQGYNQGRSQGRGSPGYPQHGRGGSRGWNHSPSQSGYNHQQQPYQHQPHQQSPPYQHHQQQQPHYQQQHQQQQHWAHSGSSAPTRYSHPGSDSYGYGHEAPERSRYQSGDEHQRYWPNPESELQRFPAQEDSRRQKNFGPEDPHRTRSPTMSGSEVRTRRNSISADPGSKPREQIKSEPATPEKPKVFSPPTTSSSSTSASKRRQSFNESADDKNESDSDALVIDFEDDDVTNKKVVSKRKSTTSNDDGDVDVLEAKLAEITGEKPKPSKRKRKSGRGESSDDDVMDSKETKKKSNPGKDFRIPKKRNSGPVAEPPEVPGSNPLTSPKTEKKFELVEDALEAMFAGVSGDKSESKTPVIKEEESTRSKTSKPGVKPATSTSKDTPKPKKKPPPKPQPKKSGKIQPDPKNVPVNLNGNARIARKKKSAATTEQEVLLEKHRGPFVRIEGDFSSPVWSRVINSTSDPLTRSEEASAPKADLEMKVRAAGFGTHSTTLSSKYDAKKPDESWLCVFCKKPSHYKGLGDLFGPYFVSREVMISVSQRSPQKKQDLASKFIIGGADKKKRKKILSSSENCVNEQPVVQAAVQAHQHLAGVAQGSGAAGVEVWFHEDCVCWVQGVQLVGHNLLGLDDAVRASHKELCVRCHVTGSTVGCIQAGCRQTCHYLCALQSNWLVDSESFQALCSLHL